MSSGNGKAEERKGWVVALFGARSFFGRLAPNPHDLGDVLGPVYELQEERMPQQLPNGQIGIQKSLSIAPVANLVGINKITLPREGVIVVPLEEIDDKTTRANLFALVAKIEDTLAQQKRTQAGIAMAEQAAKETKFGGGPREG